MPENLILVKTYLTLNLQIIVNYQQWSSSSHHIPTFGLQLITGLIILIFG
jgi:hypothetical protein